MDDRINAHAGNRPLGSFDLPRHEWRRAGAALATGVVYYLGAQVGLALTFAPFPLAVLWPPNALLFFKITRGGCDSVVRGRFNPSQAASGRSRFAAPGMNLSVRQSTQNAVSIALASESP